MKKKTYTKPHQPKSQHEGVASVDLPIDWEVIGNWWMIENESQLYSGIWHKRVCLCSSRWSHTQAHTNGIKKTPQWNLQRAHRLKLWGNHNGEDKVCTKVGKWGMALINMYSMHISNNKWFLKQARLTSNNAISINFLTVFSKVLWNRAESVSTREKSYHKAIKTWKVFQLASASCYSSSSRINDTVLVEASLGIWCSSSHSNSPTLGFCDKFYSQDYLSLFTRHY